MSQTEKITFPGGNQELLAASLEMPDDRPIACAIFAHCFTCTQNVFAASRISKKLAQNGIAVLRFDFTGLGSSEGDFGNTNFSSNIKDLVAAAAYLRERMEGPSLLIGHSLGGAAVLAAAAQIPESKAVVTIGAPFDPVHVEKLMVSGLSEIEADGKAEVSIGGRPFCIRKDFLDDLRRQESEDYIGNLGKALLVFHSPHDATVGVENARLIFDAANHPKSFVSLDEADHLLSKRVDALYVADVLTAWSQRYVGLRAEPMVRAAEEERVVTVRELPEGKFANAITIAGHAMKADEPESVGGDDTGPSPYEFVMAGLGACTTMTMRMYAERKGWPLKSASVRLKHAKIVMEEAGKRRTIDQFERAIIIEGDLSPDQRRRIFEIANRCPVHRTLEHGSEVVSTLLKDP